MSVLNPIVFTVVVALIALALTIFIRKYWTKPTSALDTVGQVLLIVLVTAIACVVVWLCYDWLILGVNPLPLTRVSESPTETVRCVGVPRMFGKMTITVPVCR